MISRFDENYVFISREDPENAAGFIAQKRVIVPGIIIDGVMEVQQGLNPGDNVIVRGQGLLDDGAKINIVDRLAPLN